MSAGMGKGYSSSRLEDWSALLNVSRLKTRRLEPFAAFCPATLANDGESFMNSLFSWATATIAAELSAFVTGVKTIQKIAVRMTVRKEKIVRVVITWYLVFELMKLRRKDTNNSRLQPHFCFE